MKDTILELIKSENPKNPYKDEELAELLHTTRYEVIRMRKKHGIFDCRKRRLPLLISSIENILKDQGNLSTATLTDQLVEMGFNVSRFLIAELRESIEVDGPFISTKKPVKIETMPQETTKLESNEMVGQNGSIEKPLRKMKAAMLYPPNGLNTIVVGETGTGKSLLVDLTFKQLKDKGLIPPTKKLVKYNCADYANNPQLLASQLFGYMKGTFTGADSDKDGLIKEADGGILFLDEIHRLSNEGQEMLFTVIDDGKYRRLGQSAKSENIQVMIIGATTENADSSLLDTFKRRIPMIIELPPLKNRSLEEKFLLVSKILQREANAINRKIIVKAECLANLLTYPCKGNIGQLTSDIKVAVANGFLRTVEESVEEIILEIIDFGKDVQEGFTKDLICEEVEFYRDHGIIIKPYANSIEYIDEKNIYVMPNKIFKTIRDRYDLFTEQGLPIKLIDALICRELEYRLSKMIKTIKSENSQLTKAYHIEKVLERQFTKGIVALIERKVGSMDGDIKHSLLFTIDDMITKVNEKWDFVDFEMSRIAKTHLMEYSIALEIVEEMETEFKYRLPKELAGVIALYLKNNAEESVKERLVRILIITHGDIGREIAKVANTFVGEPILDWLSLPLHLKKEEYIDYVLEKISRIEEENILLLVDMGSPLILGEIIANRTDKKTKTVSRVDLAIALEAAVKLKQANINLEEIYDYVKCKSHIVERKNVGKARRGENIIVVSSITGQGAAIGIKTYIEDNYPCILARGINVLPIGALEQDIEEYLNEIKRNNTIIACIGAIPIQISDVPFIKIEDIMRAEGNDILNRVIDESLPKPSSQGAGIAAYVFENAIFKNYRCRDKMEAISLIADELHLLGYVTDEYKSNILAREKAIGTEYKNGTAIPHTYSRYVKKSVIAIVDFTEPIQWAQDYLCDTMFMIALKDEDTKALKGLSKLINNEKLLEQIKVGDAKEILELINNRR